MDIVTYDRAKDKTVKVGELIGGIFRKSVVRKRHFLRVVSGYAIQEDAIERLKGLDVQKIIIYEKDTKRELAISFSDFLAHSKLWSHGHGKQLVVSERFFEDKAEGAEIIKFQDEWLMILAAGRRNGLTSDQLIMLLAIREAEAGEKGNEFGVKGVTAASIVKNTARYREYLITGRYKKAVIFIGDKPIDFVEFMAYWGGPYGTGWAPLVGKDREINKYWADNVRYYMEEIRKSVLEKKEKGKSNGLK